MKKNLLILLIVFFLASLASANGDFWQNVSWDTDILFNTSYVLNGNWSGNNYSTPEWGHITALLYPINISDTSYGGYSDLTRWRIGFKSRMTSYNGTLPFCDTGNYNTTMATGLWLFSPNTNDLGLKLVDCYGFNVYKNICYNPTTGEINITSYQYCVVNETDNAYNNTRRPFELAILRNGGGEESNQSLILFNKNNNMLGRYWGGNFNGQQYNPYRIQDTYFYDVATTTTTTTTTSTTTTTLDPAYTAYITFLRQDLTGQWLNSVLHILGNSSGVWADYYNHTWMAGGTIGPVPLATNQVYRVVITQGSSVIDKGEITFSQNATQPISITYPIIDYGTSPMTGISMYVWQNKSLLKLYCAYYVESYLNFTGATFSVYNASSIPPALLYTATITTGYNGTFTYTVPDENLSYKTECSVTIVNQTFMRVDYFNFGNYSVFMGPQGANMPNGLFGYTWAEIFQGISLLLILFIFGISSQTNSSIIALFAIGVSWLLYYWGWFVIHPIIIGFLIIFAVIYRFRQAKEGRG